MKIQKIVVSKFRVSIFILANETKDNNRVYKKKHVSSNFWVFW